MKMNLKKIVGLGFFISLLSFMPYTAFAEEVWYEVGNVELYFDTESGAIMDSSIILESEPTEKEIEESEKIEAQVEELFDKMTANSNESDGTPILRIEEHKQREKHLSEFREIHKQIRELQKQQDDIEHFVVQRLEIPSEINGVPVTRIEYASIPAEEVVIPDTVTYIGEGSFPKAKSIVLPKNIKEIGEGAFAGCTFLESITIPEGVTSIGENAFGGCYSLKNVVIPEGVKSIGKGAFANCDSLESIKIPGSVESIGSIENRVGSIQAGAFQNCASLKNVVLSDGIKSIGDYTFDMCTSLQEIKIPGSVESIGNHIFYYCPALKNVVLSDGIKEIYSEIFVCCRALENIVLPDSFNVIDPDKEENTDLITATKIRSLFAVEEDTEGDVAQNVTLHVNKGSKTEEAIKEEYSYTSYKNYTKEDGEKNTLAPGGTGKFKYDNNMDISSYGISDDIENTNAADNSGKEIKLTIGNKFILSGSEKIALSDAPYIQKESNSTLVPLSAVAEGLFGGNISIDWDAKGKIAKVKKGNDEINFYVGKSEMTINGTKKTIANNAKAEILNGRTFVPFRALGEALGVQVDWDNASKTITLKSK